MKLIFIEKRKAEDDAVTFIFKPKKKFSWKPGQYLFYTLPTKNPDEKGVTRYFTISSTPFEGHIAITTRIFEKPSTFKKSLMKLKTGDEIEASGPDGEFVIENPKRNLIFIAGGIGITPFRSILTEFSHKDQKLNVQLLYANRNEDIVFEDELESLKNKNSNLKIEYFLSPIHIDEKSISKLNSKLLILDSQFFVSGSSPFVRTIRALILDQGVEKENIKTDSFSGYS